MAPKKFRGPGLLGWLANEKEAAKREAARRKALREQMSDKRPKPKPEKPKSWSAQQMEAASQSLSAHASKNHNLNFKDKPPAKPQPSSSPKPTATTSGGGRGGSATPPASRPSGGGGGGRVSASVGIPKVTGTSGGGAPSKIHTYKEHGSDLHVGRYKTLAEHRAAVEKAKGGGSSSSSVGPVKDGDEYARSHNKGSAGNFTDNQIGYNPQNKVDGSKFEAGKAAQNRTGDKNPDVTSKQTQKYLDELKRKREGKSNVIG